PDLRRRLPHPGEAAGGDPPPGRPAAAQGRGLPGEAPRPAAPGRLPGRAPPPRRPLPLRRPPGLLARWAPPPRRRLSPRRGRALDLPRGGPGNAGAGLGGRLDLEHDPRRPGRLLVAERGDAALALARLAPPPHPLGHGRLPRPPLLRARGPGRP